MTKTERYLRKQIKTLEADIKSDGEVYSRGLLAAYVATLDVLEEEKREDSALFKRLEGPCTKS